MEAIMKAFEKLEKREERRKEALNRIGGDKPERRKSIVKEEPLGPAKGKGNVKSASSSHDRKQPEVEAPVEEVSLTVTLCDGFSSTNAYGNIVLFI